MGVNRIRCVIILCLLAGSNCEPECDPDAVFQERIAGSDWLQCGDLTDEDDRTDAAQCLNDRDAEGMPVYVRLSTHYGVAYVYIGDDGLYGVLTWGGQANSCGGDSIKRKAPCPVEPSIDAFENHEHLAVHCTSAPEYLCN